MPNVTRAKINIPHSAHKSTRFTQAVGVKNLSPGSIHNGYHTLLLKLMDIMASFSHQAHCVTLVCKNRDKSLRQGLVTLDLFSSLRVLSQSDA